MTSLSPLQLLLELPPEGGEIARLLTDQQAQIESFARELREEGRAVQIEQLLVPSSVRAAFFKASRESYSHTPAEAQETLERWVARLRALSQEFSLPSQQEKPSRESTD